MEQMVVVNKKATPPRGYGMHYIGRPSPLGNPFPLPRVGEPGLTRDKAISSFRTYLREQYVANGPVRRALEDLAERIRGGECIALQCWCSPLPCHGDVIKEAVEGINRRYDARLLEEQRREAGADDSGRD